MTQALTRLRRVRVHLRRAAIWTRRGARLARRGLVRVLMLVLAVSIGSGTFG